jgi:hypothetical protein
MAQAKMPDHSSFSFSASRKSRSPAGIVTVKGIRLHPQNAWSRFSLRGSLFYPFNIDDERDAAVANYRRLNVAARTNRASSKNFASDT